MSYLVHLRHFEGPLDLLLYLIRKEEMDIFDININEITKQFLEYIKIMKEFDLEVAGEFVAMAATLIQIKSRMLLPQYNQEGEIVEVEDPRKELVQKLLEYQKFQAAGKSLYERPLLTRDVFVSGLQDAPIEVDGDEIEIGEDGLFGLISAYRVAMRKMGRAIHKVQAKVQSIASRIMEMRDALKVGTRVVMKDLMGIGVHAGTPRLQLLITFLSILELGRLGFVSLFQSETYGDIYIEAKRPIEENLLDKVQEFDTNGEAAKAAAAAASAAAQPIPGEAAPAEITPVTPAPALSDAQLELAFAKEEQQPIEAIETLSPDDIATDEEILAAERELNLMEGEGLTVDIAGIEAQLGDLSFVESATTTDTETVPLAGTETVSEIALDTEKVSETDMAFEPVAVSETDAGTVAESASATVTDSVAEAETLSAAEAATEAAAETVSQTATSAEPVPETVAGTDSVSAADIEPTDTPQSFVVAPITLEAISGPAATEEQLAPQIPEVPDPASVSSLVAMAKSGLDLFDEPAAAPVAEPKPEVKKKPPPFPDFAMFLTGDVAVGKPADSIDQGPINKDISNEEPHGEV